MIRGAWAVCGAVGAVIAVLWVVPIVAACGEIIASTAEPPGAFGYDGMRVAFRSIAWGAGCGAIAVAVGWLPGRWLGARPGGLMMVAALATVALPASLFFDAWWVEAGPQSVVGRWAAANGTVGFVREAALAASLVGWAWPITSFIVAALGGRDRSRWLVRLDGLSVVRRARVFVTREAWTLLTAWLLTSAIIAGNTVSFDLGQVASWGFELKTLDARGASAGTVLRAGLLAIALTVVVVCVVGFALHQRVKQRGVCAERPSRLGWIAPVVVSLVPVALLATRAFGAIDGELFAIHGAAILNTLALGAVCAVLGAVLAVGSCAAAVGGRVSARVGVGVAVLFGVWAIAPASLVAIAWEAAWNRPFFERLYDSFLGLGLGVVGRVAVLAWGAGMIAASGVPRETLLIDAPSTTRAFVRASRPWLVRSALSGGVLAGVLGMGEIALSSRIQPPGVPLLSTALLNAMHYQYIDTVLPAVLGLVVLAIVAAVVPVRALRRLAVLVGVATMLTLAMPGCTPPPPNVLDPTPVAATVTFGGPGTVPGQFDYPRAIAIDPSGGGLVVIDKSARVQRFALDGTYLNGWRMPQWENGKPTGVAIAEDGRIFVADTHYHRVAVFDSEGHETLAFGSYGEGPGEFIYPTDVAFGPRGTLFVSEYGGNDRIQVFDRDGTYLRSFGSMGDGEGKFSRPQAIEWREATGELFIADAINHRIVVTDQAGHWKRVLGGAGRDPGSFAYPYDLTLLDDGSLMVVEFGNNRVQHLDGMTGECLGLWGGTGREEGRLRYPWGIDAENGVVAVLDSGNSRVLIGDAP